MLFLAPGSAMGGARPERVVSRNGVEIQVGDAPFELGSALADAVDLPGKLANRLCEVLSRLDTLRSGFASVSPQSKRNSSA